MAAMNMVSAGGFLRVSFHLGRCPQGVNYLCTLKENPHIWVPTIKIRPPDGMCCPLVGHTPADTIYLIVI